MNGPGSTPAALREAASLPAKLALDARAPLGLVGESRCFEILEGHADIFAVREAGRGVRRHLFRLHAGETIYPLPAGSSLQVVAIGAPGAFVRALERADATHERLDAWLSQICRLLAGPNPSWEIREASVGDGIELAASERLRGPARGVSWVACDGSAKLMGSSDISVSAVPLPLTSGLWLVAGDAGCRINCVPRPAEPALWLAIDRFHRSALECIDQLLQADHVASLRTLGHREDLARSMAADTVERLSGIVSPRERQEFEPEGGNPLLGAFRLVARILGAPAPAFRRAEGGTGFDELTELARAARLRVRRTLLRGDWWRTDAGPLIGWLGAEARPVALIVRRNRYVLFDAAAGTSRIVDRALASELQPEAATFYPTLPSSALSARDVLRFILRHTRGSVARIVAAVALSGLFAMIPPVMTQIIVNSVIPRTEMDQLTFCILAMVVSAIVIGSAQLTEGIAMMRLEGTIDWRLQAAIIDRTLHLPASTFRDFTVGNLVDRALGVDAARRIFTGRVFRGLLSGMQCWFSIGLMLFYDLKLGLIALGLILLRAGVIMATSLKRLFHENRHFAIRGEISGFILQLVSGISKLRVAAATSRALSAWSRRFAAQKQHFMASQRAANTLMVFETTFATAATLIIFATAAATRDKLMLNFGGFLAFYAAFGQSVASVGAWATGLSEALIAIPHLKRLAPLVSTPTEASDERKSPGELSGAVEFSRITFRYLANGPPVLDNVTLRIAAGEYVAIIGPSGSGKSTLFRLLLGFERAESGTVFMDGKAVDTLDVGAVRRQLGVVLQNGKLMTGSIYDNICGGVRLPLDHAWEAARMAGLDDDIRHMPMGMHTMVAEGINTLSGGQRQRVMIARALARRPRILLFDEATSALDNRSQAVVSGALGNLNLTRIVIAHRLSTVRQADRIVVMEGGKIVQSGSFDELSRVEGLFASFARRQLLS